ncbi:hypothetical protein GGR56DRAFT_533542 [Xylariaceae sp. FL0804]|nr:hypothetical protein GGR56DRAFT_533542 [Xylariaceae sp. FL0804]
MVTAAGPRPLLEPLTWDEEKTCMGSGPIACTQVVFAFLATFLLDAALAASLLEELRSLDRRQHFMRHQRQYPEYYRTGEIAGPSMPGSRMTFDAITPRQRWPRPWPPEPKENPQLGFFGSSRPHGAERRLHTALHGVPLLPLPRRHTPCPPIPWRPHSRPLAATGTARPAHCSRRCFAAPSLLPPKSSVADSSLTEALIVTFSAIKPSVADLAATKSSIAEISTTKFSITEFPAPSPRKLYTVART